MAGNKKQRTPAINKQRDNIAMNLPLILKVREFNFCLREKQIMGHFGGITFLTNFLSLA
jgi:hypothetical protein